MKRFWISGMVFAAFLCLTAGACAAESPLWDEDLAEGEVSIVAEDGKGYLSWGATAGAAEYEVSRSVSLYGTYTPVDTVKNCRLKISDRLYDYYRVTAIVGGGEVPVGEPVSVFMNTLVIAPGDDMDKVQAHIDAAHERLETGAVGQFSSERFAIMLLPGEYPELEIKIGYYTSVHGLGDSPQDVTVGKLYISDRVLSNQNSTCTFWRSVENFTVSSDVTFAVSQATSIRRMNFLGNLKLSYPGWSSGGFLANSRVAGSVDPGSQQQWMSRNDEWGRWTSGGSHNYVFSGCVGTMPADAWSERDGRVTILDKTEKMAEKPFLIYSGNKYYVFVPDVEENTSGVTWQNEEGEAGSYLSLDTFRIASERDTAATLNKALKKGNLLIPAGIFMLERPLEVVNADTVILGIGYGTLEIAPENRICAIRVAETDGVRLADLLIDAGPYSKNMVVVGKEGTHVSHRDDPSVLSDLYLRIGGKENVHTETETALVICSDDVLGDNFWLWRADHSRGVAWNDAEETDEEGNVRINYGNPAITGLLVEGDRVACYALMVEHFEGYQTEWRGEDGLTVMYQSETPYRVPTQEDWMSPDGKKGCASYKVADMVSTHRAYGIGIYLVNYSGMELDSAIEVPEAMGISMNHLVICRFSNDGGAKINHIVNDYGSGVGDQFRSLVEKYPL